MNISPGVLVNVCTIKLTCNTAEMVTFCFGALNSVVFLCELEKYRIKNSKNKVSYHKVWSHSLSKLNKLDAETKNLIVNTGEKEANSSFRATWYF